MFKELRLIRLYFLNSLQISLTNIPIFLIFFLAKLIRYGMFILFLYFLLANVTTLGGYTRPQVILFYLVFTFIDTLAQLLFREVYRFRPMLVSGSFDLVLLKPQQPLIRVLFGGPDLIDMAILSLVFISCTFLISTIHPSLLNLVYGILLVFNALILAASLHIIILAIGVISISIDHLIMIYRDLTAMLRIPVDFYSPVLRSVLLFVLPLGIMFTFPSYALLGLLSWPTVLACFMLGIIALWLALKFWHFSLKYYQSAGS